ncbi:MAG TPA: hypothetical protein VKA32_02435 [Gammaproteobacteria bacterium]|nr:hypothetical protein [Gammaproteobacteria bacterium]
MTLEVGLARLAGALGAPTPAVDASVRLPVETAAWVGRSDTHPIRFWGGHGAADPPPAVWLTADARRAPAADIPYLVTGLDEAAAAYRIDRLLDSLLPFTLHATLVSVLGTGVLLRGASGAGKSETALGLLDRGHKLVADDAVSIVARDAQTLEGHAESAGNGTLLLRGLGPLDVDHHFPGQTQATAPIEMVVDIHSNAAGSPLTGTWLQSGLLGRSLDGVVLAPARPLALLIETAVRERQLRGRGYNALEGLLCRHREHLE